VPQATKDFHVIWLIVALDLIIAYARQLVRDHCIESGSIYILTFAKTPLRIVLTLNNVFRLPLRDIYNETRRISFA
jgi:hypothetical protein